MRSPSIAVLTGIDAGGENVGEQIVACGADLHRKPQ
jgi:hypothetical protein